MNSILQSKDIPGDVIWKTYFYGVYVNFEENTNNYDNQNIICSNLIFDNMNAMTVSLSGSSKVLFNFVVFQNCQMKENNHIINSNCRGVSLFRCAVLNCCSPGLCYFILHRVNSESELFIDLCSFSNNGIIENDWRNVYIYGGKFDTNEDNCSYCNGNFETTFTIDLTDKGSSHKLLKICNNQGLNRIITFEKEYNVIRASFFMDNGDQRTQSLIYSSESITHFQSCFFDGNIGRTNFYWIVDNNIEIIFNGCYMQEKFGTLENNILKFTQDPIPKDCFSELLYFKIKETMSCNKPIHHKHSVLLISFSLLHLQSYCHVNY